MRFIFASLFLLVASHAAADDFSYEDLVSLIQTQHLQSIEDVLARLPESFRSNYTLMHTSRSLQGASYLNPRAILFGDHAKFTCAFNGDASQAGFNSLECFQFRDSERRFDFRQIQFPSGTNGLSEVRFSQSNRSADGRVSCTDCHGADPRPNWDGYSIWQGAYGSEDDLLYGDEQTRYPDFVAGRSAHPRYKWLIQAADANAPYGIDDPGRRPNLHFSDFVNGWNAYRANRIMRSQIPDWRVLAFSVAALQCTLSEVQLNRIVAAGLDFKKDGDPTRIFQKLGLKPNEWSTQIFDDHSSTGEDYDHQGGFGYLAIDLAMVQIRDLGEAGNQVFRAVVPKIWDSYTRNRSDDGYLGYFQRLFAVIPDPDFFRGFAENTGAICPELTQIFTDEYLASVGH